MRKPGGMSDVMIEIEETLVSTTLSYQEIADKLNVPLDWVESVASILTNEYGTIEPR